MVYGLGLQEDLRNFQNGRKGEKCSLMSTMLHSISGYKKPKLAMNGVKIESIQCIKDLGITIALNLKFSKQCKDAMGKVKKILGSIKHKFLFTE